MLEQNHSDESSIRTNQNVHESDSALMKTNTELLQEIEDMLEAPNAEFELDTDKLTHYLEILQDRAPVAEDYVPGEVWETLKSKLGNFSAEESDRLNHGQDASQGSFTPRHKTFTRIAASIIAAMLALLMTATAFGFNPIQVFFDWTEGVVEMWGNPSGVMELQAVAPGEYKSLEEALEANGVSSSGLPTWVPKDYMITGVNAQNAGAMQKFSAVYEGTRGELLIRVIKLSTSDWGFSEETEAGGYAFEHQGVEYYIVSNSEQAKAGWKMGEYSYLISGYISEDELKTMINSIS